MSESNVTWVSCDGGPHLLLLPAELVSEWEGASVPSGGRVVNTKFRWNGDPKAPATDYDRACDVNGALGLIPVGWGMGLVINDDVPMSTWVESPDGDGGNVVVTITRGEFGDDEVVQAVRAIPDTMFQGTGMTISAGNGGMFLFPAADASDHWVYGYLKVVLGEGVYRILTTECEPLVGHQLRVHRLRRRSAG